MSKISGEPTSGIQSVVLALRILEHLAQSRDAVGVTALATMLGSTKSRIYRHLQTLVQQGYIIQPEGSERYKVGSRLITLGQQVWQNNDLVSAASQPMRDLRETLGHSCVLGQQEANGVRVISTLPGKAAIDVGVKAGSLLEFHNSAQGKAMLAHMTTQALEEILRKPLLKSTEQTITDPAVLRLHLLDIRTQGWATAANESASGLNALAFPIFNETGAIFGTLAIVDLVHFVGAVPTDEQVSNVAHAARQISQAIGYAG